MSDSNNAATSSWRITVRQLESLVRLSEALARLHCGREVKAEHVNQAAKLLNKSVVSIILEKADVDLEDDDFDKDIVVVEANKENEEERMEHDGEDAENLKPKIDPAKLKLKYEDYKKYKLGDEDYGGVKQSELVDWYLNTIEEDLGSEEDYFVQKTVCKRVIRRLIHDERVFSKSNKEMTRHFVCIQTTP
ncbi:unnamed protein product [Caenorhabditis bovis]|uniref:MCM AAA-lid domain-containing protein n=1 Tax=Caenorhabditis bovis TaxID=2654633 RepID=A0A8S1ETL1_9PELO|nr:unnamed protein product [Caenorhabditis bovis]